MGLWGLLTTMLKNCKNLCSKYLTTVGESALISLHLVFQSTDSISSALYVLLSTTCPSDHSSSGHFVSAHDCDINSDGNHSCLIIANASFFLLLRYAGEFLIVLNM